MRYQNTDKATSVLNDEYILLISALQDLLAFKTATENLGDILRKWQEIACRILLLYLSVD